MTATATPSTERTMGFQAELMRPPLDYPSIAYHEMLSIATERHPERTAIIFKSDTLTYRELNGLTNSFARALAALGIAKGSRVCLYMTNRPEYVVSFFAITRLGAVVSPMNPSYKQREVAYQLGNAEAVAAVVQGELLPIALEAAATAPNLRTIITTGPKARQAIAEATNVPAHITLYAFPDIVAQQPPTPPPHVDIDDDDLVALPYSSGTTGLPKGVLLTQSNLVRNAIQFLATTRTTSDDRVMLFLPFYHIYGVMLMGATLYGGAVGVVMERFEPQEFFRLMGSQRVTKLYVAPPVLVALAGLPNLADIAAKAFGHLQFIMSGAAPLAPEVARKVQEITGVTVLQGYGMTEASPLTHINPVYDRALIKAASVGLPVHNTDQRIVDIETGERDLAPGETGELIVRGPQVMQGYWNAPEATAATLRDGWLYTGDIGSIDADGYIYISDRKKEMIKYKGFGIAPAELEALMFEHPDVADVAVIGKPDDEAGEIPKAFVVLKPGAAATAEELVEFGNGKLAGYKRIGEVEFIDVIPKNASGKLLRRELKERERQKLGL